jgi:hypothetical protein
MDCGLLLVWLLPFTPSTERASLDPLIHHLLLIVVDARKEV